VGTLSKLRRLVLREGVSVREAAQRLGIARNTASRWLALVDVTEPRYPKRVPAKSILEPFKEQMNLWLKADLHRGKRDRRTTKEIFEAIRELGYMGSRGPVYEYCKYWREQQKTTPRHAGFVPLSFELGEAFQFVETGNQSWRFRSSTAKVKGAKTSRTKLSKGDEETAVSQDLSTIL
jgi:transcriptional regulator with XRE-family HTH domain